MKHLLVALLTLLLLAACGEERQTFLLEGTFKGFNQGELYIYGAEGNREMDTIAVVKGRFHYEIPLEDSTTFVLVFPNFTELPVFGTKGAEITIEADASHLREAKVTGNRENEEFTKFRKSNIDQAPAEFALSVANFIKDNPASPFATYLLRRYFVQTPEPNYPRAIELAQAILKNHRDTTGLDKFLRRFEGLRYLRDGGRLPAFTVTDVLGRPVKSSDLDAKCNVISVWSSENYESQSMERQLQSKRQRYGGDLKLLSICLDADVRNIRRKASSDTLMATTVCDGKMWETHLLELTGLSHVPDNIVTDSQGKIIAHSLNPYELMQKIESILEKKE